MPESSDSDPHPYRLGYRDGFRDGFAEADRSKSASHKGEDDQGNSKEKKSSDDDSSGDNNNDNQDGDEKSGEQDKTDGQGNKDKDKDKDKDKNKKPIYKRPLLVAAALVVLLALIIGAIIFWRYSSHHESSDDAFIDGQTSLVAAQTSGRVTHLYVTDNQFVKAGEPLLDIDSRDVDARVEQTRAQLAGAQGQLEEANAQIPVRRANAAQADAAARQSAAEWNKTLMDLARYRAVDQDAVPRQEVDAAQTAERSAHAQADAARSSAHAAHAQIDVALAQVRSAQAQIEAARASLGSAQLQGTYTHVVAPIDGRVSRRSVDVGNVIASGQALMALVSDSLWVVANYKETQLARMQPGQAAEIVVDAYPDVKFHGHVDSIQRATGAYFSMLPAENATGNYVKVVQRVPVKLVFDDDRIHNYAIGPGMSAQPDVSLP